MSYLNSSKHLENLKKARSRIPVSNCQYCEKQLTKGNIHKHESSCMYNPLNMSNCIECGVVTHKKNKFCSRKCSCSFNNRSKIGPNNPRWKDDVYRTTCFHYHEKKCIICDEVNIVEVHHFDENHANNHPQNLVPLCPTHHKYIHSNYKHLVYPQVEEYVLSFGQGPR